MRSVISEIKDRFEIGVDLYRGMFFEEWGNKGCMGTWGKYL